MGRKSRIKGKTYERKVADILNKHYGVDSFKRRWSGRAETPQGGDLLKPDWFPFVIECRDRECWSFEEMFRNGKNSIISKWFNEMVLKNKTDDIILVFSRNRKGDYVAVLWYKVMPQDINWTIRMSMFDGTKYLVVMTLKDFLNCVEKSCEEEHTQ